MDSRLEAVDKLMDAVDEATSVVGEAERKLVFATLAVDPHDPATLYWLAACAAVRAAELDVEVSS
jgi:hypothetical protein